MPMHIESLQAGPQDTSEERSHGPGKVESDQQHEHSGPGQKDKTQDRSNDHRDILLDVLHVNVRM